MQRHMARHVECLNIKEDPDDNAVLESIKQDDMIKEEVLEEGIVIYPEDTPVKTEPTDQIINDPLACDRILSENKD